MCDPSCWLLHFSNNRHGDLLRKKLTHQQTKRSPHSTDMQNTDFDGKLGYVTKTLLTFWKFTPFDIVMFSESWVLHSSLSQYSSTWLSPLYELPFSLAQSLSVLRQELLQLPNLESFVPYLQIVIFLCWHLAFLSFEREKLLQHHFHCF